MLNGYWVLDPSRSDPPTPHLAALGLGDLSLSAAAKISASVSLRILLRGGELSVTHISSLGEKERRMVLGENVSENGRDGTTIRLHTEQLSAVQLRTHCEYGKARIVETKTLASQDQLVQEIIMTLKNVVTTSTRVFTRSEAVQAQAAASVPIVSGGFGLPSVAREK